MELYSVVDAGQIERIHQASLEVPKRSGVVVYDEDALNLLQSFGCEADQRKKIVKFPENVIEETIKKTPHSFVLSGGDR